MVTAAADTATADTAIAGEKMEKNIIYRNKKRKQGKGIL